MLDTYQTQLRLGSSSKAGVCVVHDAHDIKMMLNAKQVSRYRAPRML